MGRRGNAALPCRRDASDPGFLRFFRRILARSAVPLGLGLSRFNPALKRWAIFNCSFGTEREGHSGLRRFFTQPLRVLGGGRLQRIRGCGCTNGDMGRRGNAALPCRRDASGPGFLRFFRRILARSAVPLGLGLLPFNPALKRWAIFNCSFGTEREGHSGLRRFFTQPLRVLRRWKTAKNSLVRMHQRGYGAARQRRPTLPGGRRRSRVSAILSPHPCAVGRPFGTWVVAL